MNGVQEIKRFAYHDQCAFPAEYIACRLDQSVNRCDFAVFVKRTGHALTEPLNVYASLETKEEVIEYAYRCAMDLPRPNIIFAGVNYDGLSKRSVDIWIQKNKQKYGHLYLLRCVAYGQDRHAIKAIPHDWLTLKQRLAV